MTPRLQQALKLAPDDADIHSNLGRVHFRKGELQKAIAAYNQSLRLDPKRAEVWCDRGYARALLGDLEKALELGLEPEAESYALKTLARITRLQGQ